MAFWGLLYKTAPLESSSRNSLSTTATRLARLRGVSRSSMPFTPNGGFSLSPLLLLLLIPSPRPPTLEQDSPRFFQAPLPRAGARRLQHGPLRLAVELDGPNGCMGKLGSGVRPPGPVTRERFFKPLDRCREGVDVDGIEHDESDGEAALLRGGQRKSCGEEKRGESGSPEHWVTSERGPWLGWPAAMRCRALLWLLQSARRE